MKRLIVSLLCLASLSAMLVGLSSPNGVNDQHAFSLNTDKEEIEHTYIPEGYFDIPYRSHYGRIYKDSISEEKIVIARVKIEKCQINDPDAAYKGGDIIPGGFSKDGVTYASRIRVNKYEDSIIYGDLIDETTIEVNVHDALLPVDLSSISFKVDWRQKKLVSTLLSAEYSDRLFAMKASLENDGNIFANQTVEVSLSYRTVSFGGVFVKKAAVFEDSVGKYVKQISYYMKKEYYIKRYVTIVDEIPDYCNLGSDFDLVGKMVCY